MTYLIIGMLLANFGFLIIFSKQTQNKLESIIVTIRKSFNKNATSFKIYSIGFLASLLLFQITQVFILGIFSLIFTVALPGIIYSKQQRKLLEIKSDSWPYLIDDLTSAIRSGMTLSDSLVEVAKNAPELLKNETEAFAFTYRKTSQMSSALKAMNEKIIDPAGFLVARMLHVVAKSGASDLGKSLRILSEAIRDQQQLAREIKARQSWVINSARLAVISPWIVLVAIWPQPTVRLAYQSTQGQLILLFVAGVCFIAYFFMKRLALK